jgi:hypothetical protein
MDRKQELTKILGSKTNDKAVHAQAIWRVISDAQSRDEKVELLEFAISNLGKVERHPQILSNKGMEPEKWSKLAKKLQNIVTDHIRNAFFATTNSKDFAAELLRLLEFYTDPDEQTFCLGSALFDSNVIPYHNLPGDPLSISNEEFQQVILANKEKADLIHYLVRLPFYDWTQAVSQVLQVIDDVEDKKLRIALLTLYMIEKIKSQGE